MRTQKKFNINNFIGDKLKNTWVLYFKNKRESMKKKIFRHE
jgi:hypothetical protein